MIDQDLYPYGGFKGKGRLHRRTLTLGSEWLKSQTLLVWVSGSKSDVEFISTPRAKRVEVQGSPNCRGSPEGRLSHPPNTHPSLGFSPCIMRGWDKMVLSPG